MMKTQNVLTDNIKFGQEFGAAGKRAEVVVQRHPTDLGDLLGVDDLVPDLVLVEHHLN